MELATRRSGRVRRLHQRRPGAGRSADQQLLSGQDLAVAALAGYVVPHGHGTGQHDALRPGLRASQAAGRRDHDRVPAPGSPPTTQSPAGATTSRVTAARIPKRVEGSLQRSSWWLGLLALLPIACCGLPVLLAVGVSVGTGALHGGITGAALLVLGAVLVVVAVRPRTRGTAGRGTSAGTDTGTNRDRCC